MYALELFNACAVCTVCDIIQRAGKVSVSSIWIKYPPDIYFFKSEIDANLIGTEDQFYRSMSRAAILMA